MITITTDHLWCFAPQCKHFKAKRFIKYKSRTEHFFSFLNKNSFIGIPKATLKPKYFLDKINFKANELYKLVYHFISRHKEILLFIYFYFSFMLHQSLERVKLKGSNKNLCFIKTHIKKRTFTLHVRKNYQPEKTHLLKRIAAAIKNKMQLTSKMP